MPNWCENELEVYAYDEEAQEQLSEFAKLAKQNVKKEDGTFPLLSNLYPMPKEVFQGSLGKEEREKYGDKNWYDWSIQNWGTKWDVSAELVDEDEGRMIFSFMSAWSPPTEWLDYVAKKFPLLQFKMKFDEPGMGFMGVATREGSQSVNY